MDARPYQVEHYLSCDNRVLEAVICEFIAKIFEVAVV
jgi:hypothetical protein